MIKAMGNEADLMQFTYITKTYRATRRFSHFFAYNILLIMFFNTPNAQTACPATMNIPLHSDFVSRVGSGTTLPSVLSTITSDNHQALQFTPVFDAEILITMKPKASSSGDSLGTKVTIEGGHEFTTEKKIEHFFILPSKRYADGFSYILGYKTPDESALRTIEIKTTCTDIASCKPVIHCFRNTANNTKEFVSCENYFDLQESINYFADHAGICLNIDSAEGARMIPWAELAKNPCVATVRDPEKYWSDLVANSCSLLFKKKAAETKPVVLLFTKNTMFILPGFLQLGDRKNWVSDFFYSYSERWIVANALSSETWARGMGPFMIGLGLENPITNIACFDNKENLLVPQRCSDLFDVQCLTKKTNFAPSFDYSDFQYISYQNQKVSCACKATASCPAEICPTGKTCQAPCPTAAACPEGQTCQAPCPTVAACPAGQTCQAPATPTLQWCNNARKKPDAVTLSDVKRGENVVKNHKISIDLNSLGADDQIVFVLRQGTVGGSRIKFLKPSSSGPGKTEDNPISSVVRKKGDECMGTSVVATRTGDSSVTIIHPDETWKFGPIKYEGSSKLEAYAFCDEQNPNNPNDAVERPCSVPEALLCLEIRKRVR